MTLTPGHCHPIHQNDDEKSGVNATASSVNNKTNQPDSNVCDCIKHRQKAQHSQNNIINIVLATGNPDKVKEMQEIAGHTLFSFTTMSEAGFSDEIVENGESFAENALIKARAVHAQTGGYVLADDSGLSIDMLDGAPGIYSARFAGHEADYPEKITRLYQLLKPWPPSYWHAAFICVIALITPAGKEKTFYGECRGMIARQAAGENGFGYDPVFYIPELGMTTAQMEPEQKHAMSHRGKALRAACAYLDKSIDLNKNYNKYDK